MTLSLVIWMWCHQHKHSL